MNTKIQKKRKKNKNVNYSNLSLINANLSVAAADFLWKRTKTDEEQL